jgi:hypothetical protein
LDGTTLIFGLNPAMFIVKECLEDDNQKKKVESAIVLCVVDMFVEAKQYFYSLA